jgi:hypothetical protein
MIKNDQKFLIIFDHFWSFLIIFGHFWSFLIIFEHLIPIDHFYVQYKYDLWAQYFIDKWKNYGFDDEWLIALYHFGKKSKKSGHFIIFLSVSNYFPSRFFSFIIIYKIKLICRISNHLEVVLWFWNTL